MSDDAGEPDMGNTQILDGSNSLIVDVGKLTATIGLNVAIDFQRSGFISVEPGKKLIDVDHDEMVLADYLPK